MPGEITGLGSQLTNRDILAKVWTNRPIFTHNTGTQQCLRRHNGELWALTLMPGGFITAFISRDNGFSWEEMEADPSTTVDLNIGDSFFTYGPILNWVVSEKWNEVQFIFPDANTGDIQGVSIPFEDFLSTASSPNFTTTNFVVVDSIDTDADRYFRIANHQNQTFLFFVNASDQPAFRKVSPRANATSGITAITVSPVEKTFGLCVSDDSKVDLLYSITDTTQRVRHVRYDDEAVSVTAEHELLNMSANEYAETLDITYDSFGTLCAVWTVVDNSEDTTIYYATSTDNGANWDVNSLSRTSGHTSYQDAITGEGCGRTRVIGGSNGGFMFCYLEEVGGNTGKMFVRQLTTSDGSTYTLGDEKEVADHLAGNVDVVGLQFFAPMDSELMDLSDPGLVRIAYQQGESVGENSTAYVTLPVRVSQEQLFQSAYPSTLTPESGTYTFEAADSNSIAVSVNIYAGPSENIDFHDAGFTGDFTSRYEDAFDSLGTHLRVLKYEPKTDNFMNDRSAYDAPTEEYIKAVFEPITYRQPIPEIDAGEITDWTERDVRKIYLPPTKHLDRTFVINKGGFLKRTVWIVRFGGNEYELSQATPYFIDNQICYYECNAYVVGPSRDPFSRTVLPSET